MYRAYYRPVNTTKTRQPRQGHTDLVLGADRVWGAAAYADRLNGGEYRKEPEYRVREDGTYTNQVVREPNKTHMWAAIMDTSRITAADIDIGRQARDYIQKNLVVKGLRGDLSEFDQALSAVVQMDEFQTGADRYEIALVTSQIRAWREGTRMDTVMEDVVKTPVADVGAKVQLRVEVVKTVYSANYNKYFVTAKTDAHQMVFFSYREKRPVGEWITIRGAVKAHRQDATQLNRVRIV